MSYTVYMFILYNQITYTYIYICIHMYIYNIIMLMYIYMYEYVYTYMDMQVSIFPLSNTKDAISIFQLRFGRSCG